MFKPTKPQHIVNKKYADENAGGGSSGPFYTVNFSFEGEALLADKTFSEVEQAFLDGKYIVFNTPSGPSFASATFSGGSSTPTSFNAGIYTYPLPIGFTIIMVCYENNGVVTIREYFIKPDTQ